MSFGSADYLPIQRQKYLTVYAIGGSTANTNSTMIEFFTVSGPFELNKIHVHLSSLHASVVDLMVYISHYLNSYYNMNLVSQAMNGLTDHLYHPGVSAIILNSGDTIHCSMVYSGANHYGIQISGWYICTPGGGW